MPGSRSPELDLSPTTSGVAPSASESVLISAAFSFEKASTLLRILMIRTRSSSLATTSKHIPRMLSADETSNPALARMARVVLMSSVLPMVSLVIH